MYCITHHKIRRMKRIFFLILFSIGYFSNFAQVMPAAYQQGRDLYQRLAYSEAIPFLIKECTGNKNKFLEADIMLADCYRQTNQYKLAEGEYAIVCQDVRLKDDKQKLYYAQVLQTNQKYDKAAEWYGKYLEKFPMDSRAKNQKLASENVAQFTSGKKLYITNLPFNTNGYDFGACINKNTLYFTSTGGKVDDVKAKDINAWTGERFMNLYSTEIQQSDTASDIFTTAAILPNAVNTKYNEGPLCFNKDNTKVYFTRNQYNPEEKAKIAYSKEREANLSIYEATIENGNWTKIKELPFNSKQFSCGHPALDEDNKTLYFSSTMPGGFGGSDIWKVKYDGDKWEKPVNIGTSINTEGEEMFPTFDNSKTFYFASDGQGGIGGLDIFSSKMTDNGIVDLKNLGTPINSSYDDFAYLINDDKTVGFFSSDRPNGKGEDDIYRFADIEYKLEILVIHKHNKSAIANAHVQVKNGEQIKNYDYTNTDGKLIIPVEPGTTYKLQADALGYLPATVSKTIIENEKQALQKVVIELEPMVMQVKVINDVTKAPIPNAKLTCSSPCQQSVKVNSTDENGKINYAVQDKCTYTLEASAKSYLPKPASQYTITLVDTTYVIIELTQITEKAIALNNIYYDFDKWNIRPEAEEDLNMLLAFMKNNPDAIVELSSHTDARGDDAYNLSLSQKRAQSAVTWLVMHGISDSKIKPVGYGETKPVNNCRNNIKCTEEEHQRNRRTEFKVLNAGEIINSTTKERIVVDPCNNCLF